MPAHAAPINLQDLIDDKESITVDDKLFSDFASNRGDLIDVEGAIFGPNAGLRFMSTPNFGPDFMGTTNISFIVTALDQNFRISALFQAVAALPEGTGTIRITDTAFALGTNDVLGSGEILTTGLPIGGTPMVNVYALSKQVQALRFERRVDFTGPLSGGDGLTLNMSVTQSIIPEPSTVLLFGTGIAGLGLWRWKKNRAK